MSIPTENELKDVFSMPLDSAPGLDGFSATFFFNCWAIAKQDILQAAHEFFSGSHLSQSYTSSILTLIPKIQNPHKFSDFRPICLCQVVYKIFSKVIASRLTSILPCIISPYQGGFVNGRPITESLALAQELTHSLGLKQRGGNVIFKIDMSKAFDRVNWNFMFKVPQSFDFALSGFP